MLRITLTPELLHFKRPAPTSRGPLVERALWVVRAVDTCHPERVGLGECGPIAQLSADDRPSFAQEARALVNAINAAEQGLPDPDPWHLQLDALLGRWDAPLAALPSLRLGLESALLDLLNGGWGSLFASPFTLGEASLPTHGLIWMDTPDGLLAQVEAKVAAGFSVIKLKVGALPFGDELKVLHTLRARHPTIGLRLDANGAFSPVEAHARIDSLAPLGIEFLEQPIRAGQREALRALCAESPIPIALDEELIGLPATDGLGALLESVRPQAIIIKPTLIGSWRGAADAVALCERLGIKWWANSLLESSIGHDAICQWTAVYGGTRIHGLGTGSLYRENFPSPIRLNGNALQRDRDIRLGDRGAIAY